MDIVRKEINDSHFYFVNGVYFPGVTSILEEAAPTGEALKNYFKNNTPEEIEEKSSNSLKFGSRMHNAYEHLLQGDELDLKKDYPDAKEKKHIVSFASWFNDFKPEPPYEIEYVVASQKFKYAGTLDLSCTKAGELWIVDFKTSAAIYYNYQLQLAAYKQAYEEMHPAKKIAHTAVLRTGSKHNSGYEFKETTTPFQSFQYVYNIYLDLHNGVIPEPPLENVYPDTISLVVAK